MKNEVKKNLLNLYNENLKVIAPFSFGEMIDDYISMIDQSYKLSEIHNYKESDEAIQLYKLKNDQTILKSFQKAKNLDFDDQKIIIDFVSDIKKSIKEINFKLEECPQKYKNQIIFLEYDHLPEAWFFGFGKGNYPILKKPEYFEFNFKEEIYAGIGKVDYSSIWNNLLEFNEILENSEAHDFLFDSDSYNSLLNLYKYKTYLLLFEAFERIPINLFDEISIEKPLYIYGNEHDCEPINIYIYS